MIVGSLLILVAAAGLLVTGLMNRNDIFLVGSIVASVIAGVGLYLGARSSGRDDEAEEEDEAGEYQDLGGRGSRRVPERRQVREPAYAGRERYGDSGDDVDDVAAGESFERFDRSDRLDRLEALQREAREEREVSARQAAAPAVEEPAADEADVDEELADEPAPMSITRIDRTRLAGLTVPVQVVDGRPRYHLAGCVHLLGKEDESLAVNEAVELGFTPCGLCEPTADVLADLSVRSGH